HPLGAKSTPPKSEIASITQNPCSRGARSAARRKGARKTRCLAAAIPRLVGLCHRGIGAADLVSAFCCELEPILPEHLARMRRADRAIAAAQVVSSTVGIASPTDPFGMRRIKRQTCH